MFKEGYLWKKKSKAIFGGWNKRYLVLENDKFIFYEDESKKVPSKHIDMTKVKAVTFHYDEEAPIKSKKLTKKDKDDSRFDIYTPNRTYMMKSDGVGLWDAQDWVRVLKAAAKKHNSTYGKN